MFSQLHKNNFCLSILVYTQICLFLENHQFLSLLKSYSFTLLYNIILLYCFTISWNTLHSYNPLRPHGHPKFWGSWHPQSPGLTRMRTRSP